MFVDQNGYPPSLRQLMIFTSTPSFKNLHASLLRLKNEGFVTWQEGKNRTLRLIEK